MNKKQTGFNLIELMAVVVIIALLFAFAIPLYKRYLSRSQVSRVVMESGNLKTSIENCINNGLTEIGKSSESKCDTNATGSSVIIGDSQGDLVNPPGFGVPIATIDATNNTATIVATFGNSAYLNLSGEIIRWTRSSEGSWTCESTAEDKYNDPGCL